MRKVFTTSDPSKMSALKRSRCCAQIIYVVGDMKVVELNIGGRYFATTRSTLSKHGDSLLAHMFSGDLEPAQKDSQGRFFIDRNGDHFAMILAYLRDEPHQVPASALQRQALKAEAQFYQVCYQKYIK